MTDAQLLILLSTLSTGLILGAIFSLVAAGVTIVYGCVWLPNASNGQFFLLASLVAWTFTASLGWSSWLAAIAVIVLGIGLSYLLEWILIRRLYDTPNRNVAYFVVTLGMTQIMTGIFSLTYAKWSDQFSLPPVVDGISMLGPFPLSNNRLLVMVVSLFVLVALFALLRYHPYGRA
jgi:branched-chain amino acid transport system permease protein